MSGRTAKMLLKFISDISLARELLGWTPSIALEDGLRQTIDYFRNLKEF